MRSFDRVLLRLKEQLGVQTDKEAAELLGMQEKAFNARKRRDAFPDDKVLALAQRRPELGIDALYVITGVRKLETLASESDEERLLSLYRRAPEETKREIEAVSVALVEPDMAAMLHAVARASEGGKYPPAVSSGPLLADEAQAGGAPRPPTREQLAIGTGLDPMWPYVLEWIYDALNERKLRMPSGKRLRELVDAAVVLLRVEHAEGELSREDARRKIDAML